MALIASCDCDDCDKCRHRSYMRQWRQVHPENAEQNRVWARESRENRLEEVRAYDRARGYRVYDPVKVRARKAASAIPRQECEVESCSTLGDRHHDDYSNPFNVRFLCRKHHGELHRVHGGVSW